MFRINALHLEIKKFLAGRPKGATDEEMQNNIPMPANTQRPRRVELTQMNQVVDSGYWRLTKTKRKAVVWTLKEYRDKALEPLPPVPASPVSASQSSASAPTNAYYDAKGRLIHDTCAVEGCTSSPGHSIGCFLLKGQLGLWYCQLHFNSCARPDMVTSDRRYESRAPADVSESDRTGGRNVRRSFAPTRKTPTKTCGPP
jgi:hypothetical protein